MLVIQWFEDNKNYIWNTNFYSQRQHLVKEKVNNILIFIITPRKSNARINKTDILIQRDIKVHQTNCVINATSLINVISKVALNNDNYYISKIYLLH